MPVRLVWASFLVIAGVVPALRRRLRDRGAAALQDFQEDLLPLLLLFAVSEIYGGRPIAGPPRRPLARIRLEVRAGFICATGVEFRPA